MKKALQNLLLLTFAGLILGMGFLFLWGKKKHRNIEKETPAYIMDAQAFFNEYNENEAAGNLKFGDKVIQLSGQIVEISKNGNDVSLVLNDKMNGVNCALNSNLVAKNRMKIDKLRLGGIITIKGKCDGFDLIMGVVLTQCSLVEQAD